MIHPVSSENAQQQPDSSSQNGIAPESQNSSESNLEQRVEESRNMIVSNLRNYFRSAARVLPPRTNTERFFTQEEQGMLYQLQCEYITERIIERGFPDDVESVDGRNEELVSVPVFENTQNASVAVASQQSQNAVGSGTEQSNRNMLELASAQRAELSMDRFGINLGNSSPVSDSENAATSSTAQPEESAREPDRLMQILYGNRTERTFTNMLNPDGRDKAEYFRSRLQLNLSRLETMCPTPKQTSSNYESKLKAERKLHRHGVTGPYHGRPDKLKSRRTNRIPYDAVVEVAPGVPCPAGNPQRMYTELLSQTFRDSRVLNCMAAPGGMTAAQQLELALRMSAENVRKNESRCNEGSSRH